MKGSGECCPLCRSNGEDFHQGVFFQCEHCGGIFRPARLHLPAHLEKARYEQHHNDVTDEGYRQFVAPVVQAVTGRFSPHHQGLDFGAGPGPVVTAMLSERGYDIRPYDPYFHDDPEPLRRRYDYIVCCEVIEHFREPGEEFKRLYGLLNAGGWLICQTHPFTAGIDFGRWYYKNDKTHVFIYQPSTLERLQTLIGFSELRLHGRLAEFRR